MKHKSFLTVARALHQVLGSGEAFGYGASLKENPSQAR